MLGRVRAVGGRRHRVCLRGGDELVLAVTIVLNDMRPDDCPAADVDRDGAVTIAELIRAVDAGLSGCG